MISRPTVCLTLGVVAFLIGLAFSIVAPWFDPWLVRPTETLQLNRRTTP